MMAEVASLWRHPIKSHGREALAEVTLVKGQTMPWDRHWAVTHAATKFDTSAPAWASSRNFMIATLTPGLAGLWAGFDAETGVLCLRHAELGTLRFSPDDTADTPGFLAWIAPLCPPDRPQPTAIVQVPGRGMTDTPFPSVSIMNTASHRDFEVHAGASVDSERWRANIWIDGPDPWAEHGWIGRQVQIGTAIVTVRAPVKRCAHTAANPHSGQRDMDPPALLHGFYGHSDFGVYAEVVQSGMVRVGDVAKVL